MAAASPLLAALSLALALRLLLITTVVPPMRIPFSPPSMQERMYWAMIPALVSRLPISTPVAPWVPLSRSPGPASSTMTRLMHQRSRRSTMGMLRRIVSPTPSLISLSPKRWGPSILRSPASMMIHLLSMTARAGRISLVPPLTSWPTTATPMPMTRSRWYRLMEIQSVLAGLPSSAVRRQPSPSILTEASHTIPPPLPILGHLPMEQLLLTRLPTK